MRKKILTALMALGLVISALQYFSQFRTTNTVRATEIAVTFPSDKYPETAAHIKEAISHGEPQTCTIDRKDADEHRKESLKNVPTKSGYDRDEWPMAMCAEGGMGADIKYINPSDNRGAGSWFKNELDQYPDGAKVKVIVK